MRLDEEDGGGSLFLDNGQFKFCQASDGVYIKELDISEPAHIEVYPKSEHKIRSQTLVTVGLLVTRDKEQELKNLIIVLAALVVHFIFKEACD